MNHGTEVVGYLAPQSGTMDVAPDTDGDGTLNPSSLLAIQAMLMDTSGCRLQFVSVSGRRYTAEFNTNLLTTNWIPLPDCDDLVSTGGVLQVEDTNGWNRAFYRIRVHE